MKGISSFVFVWWKIKYEPSHRTHSHTHIDKSNNNNSGVVPPFVCECVGLFIQYIFFTNSQEALNLNMQTDHV